MISQGFPSSLAEFARWFPDERAAFRYLIEVRWPGRYRCPGCGGTGFYERNERLAVECKTCRKLMSATAGTVMHGSRQPLLSWLLAAWLLVGDKRGVSATQLARALDVRLETAWNMLHKLRAAMVDPDRTPLRGVIEVDETYVGGHHEGKRGRGAEGKTIVVGAVEITEKGPGRLRLRQIPDATSDNLVAFIRENVAKGSTISTDGNRAYDAVTKYGYRHESINASKAKSPDDVLPYLHVAFSNLKTWILGTFHGAVQPKHMQAYLNEFVFRYNRRGNLQAAFLRMLGLAGKVESPTYSGLYGGTFVHKNPGP